MRPHASDEEPDARRLFELLSPRLSTNEKNILMEEIERLDAGYRSRFNGLWSDINDGAVKVTVTTASNKNFTVKGHGFPQ
ncbi:unnamed protein product [Oikopleura dioica]|uniref:Uncharacterized protein n=1 Tax=Oikopleura dioica TaxID=34765 RepID=E4Z5E5_OIKDI|nr:unnamed protein product [Oikopleura dioica]